VTIWINILIISCFCVASTWATEPLHISEALKIAYSANPEIAAAQAKADAEHAAIRSESFLDDPHVGYMHDTNMNFMEQQMGPMDAWFVSQDIKFPEKYFLLGKAQSARATQADEMLKQKKLEIRERVITQYYNYFAVSRILALLDAQRETLREIARTAEARYSTGAAPQQYEMKAHMEQTELERDVLMLQQERDSTAAMLNASLGEENVPITLPQEELKAPKITTDLSRLSRMVEHHSNHVREAKARVQETEALKGLANLSYAPDFSLQYRRAFGFYASQNEYSASIGITIPLWFFVKQSGEVGAAAGRLAEAEKDLQSTVVDHVAEVSSLAAKVQSTGTVLQIYETGLIPQATSTLNSSRASYRAGRTNLIELLDSERSLYNIQIAYYRTLAQDAENVANLEKIMGESISSLPFGDVQ